MMKSGRSKAEEGLPAESAPLPNILDRCLDAAVVVIDAEQRLTAVTPEAGEILGLPDAAAGQSVDTLPEPLSAILQRTLRGKTRLVDRVILVSSGAGPRSLRVTTTPLTEGGGTVLGAVAILNDLTPARHLEENLRRLDRLASIGTLSASMAHEVKNAMVAVKTFVDLLVKKNQDAPLADIVVREMRRIDSIVSQMLRFAGPAKPTFASLSLHRVLEDSLGLVQHHLEGRKIQLHRDFRAEPDAVHADLFQLQQAFLNLFFNALEAMGATGKLEVVTEQTPSDPNYDLKITIRDSGIGVAPEHLERLFDPFFTTKADGTGLGLPITRRIIEEHQGCIVVESELNQGTVFTIRLPSPAKKP
jgi:two-component system sensor histidine kinase HydH